MPILTKACRCGHRWRIRMFLVSTLPLRLIWDSKTSNRTEFFGANVLDDKPFIVMPYYPNGNARNYVQRYPDCDRIKIVSCNLHHRICGQPAVSCTTFH